MRCINFGQAVCYTLVLLIVGTLCGLAWSAENPTSDQKLPSQVISALDTYDAMVLKSQEEYRQDVDRAKARASKLIERQLEYATKKGDLELALAIKAKLKALQEHRPGGLAEVDILGNKIKEERENKKMDLLLGNWSCTAGNISYSWKFNKDGSISGDHTFKWKIEENTLIIYETGRPLIMSFPLPINAKNWVGKHKNGISHILNKQ